MTLPNFIIIGAARSGTTSLHHYLAQHPDVFMSPVKETRFFAWQAEWAGRAEVDERALQHRYPVRDLAAYEALFAGAAGRRALGEATPHYLYLPGVPEAMASMVPRARLIAILRDPAERAFSGWTQQVLDGREQRSFEHVVEDELSRIDQPITSDRSAYLQSGLYYSHLMRFLVRFPRDRLLVLLYDDFARSAQATLRTVVQFLGVDGGALIDTSVRYNPTGVPRSAAIDRLTAKTPLTLALKVICHRQFAIPYTNSRCSCAAATASAAQWPRHCAGVCWTPSERTPWRSRISSTATSRLGAIPRHPRSAPNPGARPRDAQTQGSRSSIRLIGWSAMRAKTSRR